MSDKSHKESISTHTPHARRDTNAEDYKTKYDKISTHTPHARRDFRLSSAVLRLVRFLLTRLMRGVTLQGVLYVLSLVISTHTPHARRDEYEAILESVLVNFYSHASCEA